MHRAVWAGCFILLMAASLRWVGLDAHSLWHDEGNSLRLAERSIPALIEATSHDIHPPGYYIALKLWVTFVGTSELGLRSLSAYWGIIGVAATLGLGRRLYGWQVGAIAAVLVAINPFVVYYGQETRMYAQLGAVSLLSLWVLLQWLDTNRPTWMLGLLILNALGLYTHYTYPLTMLTQGAYFLWWWRESRRGLLSYIYANALTVVIFLPWLPTAYRHITAWPTTGDTTPTFERLERMLDLVTFGHSDLSLWVYALVAVLLIGLFRPPKHIGLPLVLCGLSIGSLLVSGAYREANLKFLLAAQGAVALLLGLSAANLHWRHLPIGLGLISIIAIGAVAGDSGIVRGDYRGMVADIQPRLGDAIILNAPNQQEVFSYYYHGTAPVFPLPLGLGGDDPATEAATHEIVEHHQRIYLVLWGQQERDPNGIVQATLDANAFVVGRRWYGDVELVQYAVLAPPPTQPTTILNMRFGEHIILLGYALSSDNFNVGQGDALGVTLFWSADAPLSKRYKISVQLLTPQGTLADQHDSEPSNDQAPTLTWQVGQTIVDNHGLALDDSLNRGDYTLVVVVYDAEQPSNRLQPANADPNAVLPLGTITLH